MNAVVAELQEKEAKKATMSTDPLCLDYFNRSEMAIYAISMMLGDNLADIMREERNKAPDPVKLNVLEEQRSELLNEQRMIYAGDAKLQDSCVKKYAPIVKERFMSRSV